MNVRAENFITIQGWMRTELNLKGNDLLVYAMIFGFSQTENQRFTGSLQYIADWCGASKQGILKNLKNLLDAGLIAKEEKFVNNIKLVEYYSTQLNTPLNSVEYPIKQSLINNIANSKNESISKDIDSTVQKFSFGKKKEKPKSKSLFDKCLDLIHAFTDDAILQSLLTEALKQFISNSKETDRPFYSNNFKGKLNQLKALTEDSYEQRKIVTQTLSKGWNDFYALKSDTRQSKPVSTDMGRQTQRLTKEQKERARKAIADGTAEKF